MSMLQHVNAILYAPELRLHTFRKEDLEVVLFLTPKAEGESCPA